MLVVKRILLCLHDTPDFHITCSRNSNIELISFHDASYGTGSLEKARSPSGSMHSLYGGDHPLQHKHPNDSGAIHKRFT